MASHAFELNLRHLRALATIVARGSMSAAADAVSLSQPALTQGLAKLEARFGQPLFERRPHGMVPTAAGTLVAARVGAALDHLAAATRGLSRGTVRPERLMTATQLRAFLALADAGSFVGAAQATGLSQPALHRAVGDLEGVVGSALVERRGRGVALNEAGRRLARGVRLAAAELTAAIAEAAPVPPAGADRLSVGAMPLSRAHLVPHAIAALAAEQPHATIDVVEGSWRELVEPLRDGVIDLMVGALRPDNVPDLEQAALHEDRLVIVARAGHPLAGAHTPPRAALAGYPWIVGRAGSPLRAQWERLFAGAPLPACPIVCGSVMVIRGLLVRGDFLTLLSPDQIALEVAGGLLTHIGAPLGASRRMIGITTRRDWRPTPLQRRFSALLDEAASAAQLPEIE